MYRNIEDRVRAIGNIHIRKIYSRTLGVIGVVEYATM